MSFLRNTLSEDARKKMSESKLGENNPRWNNGVSEYPNHYIFKKNRIEALKKTKGKCEICGNRAVIVHHIDGSKDNHNLENLIPLCRDCHKPLHSNDDNGKLLDSRTSKYVRLYGFTLRELAQIFNLKTTGSMNYLIKKHNELFEKQLKEYKENQLVLNTV